ncbi:hypothetical protein [Neobacillus cucumis]|uniref:hypothetical protein n=1 Tax=Neobacillus cucumis TaxID=1740721 RepID=UPI0019647F8A|nr:hypothetical protein [Neobacillus cucumis]MBM7651771.1 hypothetical protein [Neobacillus cucumis]
MTNLEKFKLNMAIHHEKMKVLMRLTSILATIKMSQSPVIGIKRLEEFVEQLKKEIRSIEY